MNGIPCGDYITIRTLFFNYPMGQDSERHLELLYSERVMNTEDWIYWSRKSRLYSGEVLYCQRSGCARLFQSARDLG